MNQISETDVMTSGSQSLAAAIGAASQVREFAPTGAIYMALLEAQASLHNPSKNKTADTGKFKFKFADLAAVLDIVRPALNEAGILLTQVIGKATDGQGMVMVTRLLHASSREWTETTTDLPRMADPQEWGKIVSYARRYILLSYVGIAAGDDDNDANSRRARVTERAEAPLLPIVGSERHQELLHRVTRMLDRVQDALDLDNALEFWTEHDSEMVWLYERAPEVATTLEKALGTAVERVVNRTVALAVVRSLRPMTPALSKDLQDALSGAVGREIGRLVQIRPSLSKRLRDFVESAVSFGGTPTDLHEPPAPSEPQHVDLPRYQLLDQHGDPAGEETTYPIAFVTAYAAAYADLEDAEERGLLAEVNDAQIVEACRQAPRAAEVLRDLMQGVRDAEVDPADLEVAPVLDGNGKLMVAAYLSAIKSSLASVGAGAVSAWESTNRPVYDQMPAAVKRMVLERLIARRSELGLQPKSDS